MAGQLEYVEYQSIDEQKPRRQPWHVRIRPYLVGALTMLVLLALPTIASRLVLVPKPAAEVEKEAWNDCGRSSEVAMARGCVMEPMYYGWFPPKCVYAELTGRFPVFENKQWYRDVNLTMPIPADELWRGQVSTIYTAR